MQVAGARIGNKGPDQGPPAGLEHLKSTLRGLKRINMLSTLRGEIFELNTRRVPAQDGNPYIFPPWRLEKAEKLLRGPAGRTFYHTVKQVVPQLSLSSL